MFENVAALALTTCVLVAIPGPNVALIVANSIRHGVRFGLVTVAGTTVGVALQLILILTGFAALIGVVADALTWIKWAGVAYLLYLGVKTWRTPAGDLDHVQAQIEPASKLFLRGAGLAVVNPKTLVFNAAFLPQFENRNADPVTQMIVLGVVFLIVLSLGDSIWAIIAGSARPLILKYGRLRNRITGGFLVASGIGLAVTRR